MCPARPVSLSIDTDINDNLFQMYPTTPLSKVAWIQGYNYLYDVVRNDFGDSKYSMISMSQNKMVVNSFIIAGVIAFFTALLGV
jgi:ABC-type dipeptide/oligopeptide/nickel transport system permease component